MLPLPERIAADRLLAIRVEAADTTTTGEPTTDTAAARAELLPLETAVIRPFLVDPKGPLDPGTFRPIYLACGLFPLQGLFGCLDAARPLELSSIPDCPTMPAGLDPSVGLPEIDWPCRIAQVDADGTAHYTVPLDFSFVAGGDVELTIVGSRGETSSDACAQALLTQAKQLPDDCLFGVQRLTIGPDAVLTELARGLGVEGLPDLGPPPASASEPDRHPRIQRFELEAFAPDGTSLGRLFVARGDEIGPFPLGTELRLETEIPEEDIQTYAVPDSGVRYLEIPELLTGRWFVTFGELQSPQSSDRISKNIWTLAPGKQDELEAPENDRATLYYVLRDSREGVDWWWFHLRTEAP